MRIGIDARLLEQETGLTGIAISLLEILRELNRIDTKNEYFLISRKNIHCDISFSKNWNLVVRDFPQGIIWYNTVLIKLLKEHKIDVFWNLNHILPITKPKGCKYLLTINDLAIFKLKGIGEYSNILKQHIFVKASCKMADCIIAISEATKDDLHDIFGISKKNIFVNYLGGTNKNVKVPFVDEIRVTKEKYRIDRNFFMYLGTLEPRKNLVTLVKAYNKYRTAGLGDEMLVIAGGKGWRFANTQAVIDASAFKSDILQVGYISVDDKRNLLSDCSCFVFPSLYEGFGIPIIEAMEEGCPVITSNNSSLPEVGGKFALYLDEATDAEALKQLLLKVHDMSEEERIRLKTAEKEWVQQFQWKHTAERFLKIIAEME